MPFTPFHFGPSATIALILKKQIDLPIFVLANVVIDIEPLLVMVYNLPYPVHGFFHSLIGGVVLGIVWGSIAYGFRNIFKAIMDFFHIQYVPKLKTMIISGILGCWLHVFVDSFMHADIRPLYPWSFNPLHQLISTPTLYLICTLFFVPAIALYIREVILYNKNQT